MQKLKPLWDWVSSPRRLGWGLLTVLGISCGPLLWIGLYGHPTMDDFAFSMLTVHAFRATGSLLATLATAVRTAWEQYIYWQGSFSSTFLMALQPAIFGERYYALVPWLLIISLIGATLLLAQTVLGKEKGLIVGGAAAFFSVHYAGNPSETFFWHNSGIYYTFFYALALLLYSLLLRAPRSTAAVNRTLSTIGIALLAAFIGGSNYVTALLSLVLIGLLLAYRLLIRRQGWGRPLLALLAMAATFLLSSLSPGNAARQAGLAAPLPAFTTIGLCFVAAFENFFRIFRLEYFLALLLLLPVLRRAAGESAFTFRYPLLITLVSVGVYACQFAPFLRAAGEKVGPDRIMSLIFFSTFWFLGGNAYYWCGWLSRRQRFTDQVAPLSRRFQPWLSLALAVTLLVSMGLRAWRNHDALAGVSAAYALRYGQAQSYHAGFMARLPQYEDPAVRDAVFYELPQKPYVMTGCDMSANPGDWLNELTARYYDKDSITVRPWAE